MLISADDFHNPYPGIVRRWDGMAPEIFRSRRGLQQNRRGLSAAENITGELKMAQGQLVSIPRPPGFTGSVLACVSAVL